MQMLKWTIFASACASLPRQQWRGNFRFQFEVSSRQCPPLELGRASLCDYRFGAILAAQEAEHPSFILFRETNLLIARDHLDMLLPVLPMLEPELLAGCVAVFRNGRLHFRIRAAGELVPQVFQRGRPLTCSGESANACDLC